MSSKKSSVFFLFINGPHHVYHLIEPALSFASMEHKFNSVFVSGNPINSKIIKDKKKLNENAAFTLIDLPLPLRYRIISSYREKLYPPVYTRINKIISKLKNASAIISTSHELPKYLKERNIQNPLLFYLYHGTGTREYGFDHKLNEFDYILAPGPYHRDRLIEDSVCDEKKIKMIGQPKFEAIDKKRIFKNDFFNNNNPIFYYNPHWDMNLSSYLKWRNVLIDFFKENKEYNLIFAPHPLVKHFANKKGYSVEKNSKICDNIIIDLDSRNLIDGTYNAISDVYIGDVSSMVTEWINFSPRPCIFLNPHKIDWKYNKNYEMWKYGTVIDDPKQLDGKIKQSLNHNSYHQTQKEHQQNFIYKSDISASKLCANYIFEKLEFG